MKLATIIEGVQDSLAARLEQLRPAMASAAQAIYDSWDPEHDEFGDPEVGGGGICDQIANAIGEILSDAGVDYTEGGQEGDDHAYLIAYDDQNAYTVDVPHRYYESGGGMSWSKHPDVMFTPDMVEIGETWRPDWINESYEGLEDEDEFLSDFEPCPNCGNVVDTEDLISCGQCDNQACASCVRGGEYRDFFGLTPSGWMYNRRGDSYCPRCVSENSEGEPVSESYEGLEDADEFDDQTDFCDGCGRDYSHEDLEDCTCGGIWCDYCVSSGSNFDWVPEYTENGREHPDAGQMIACPRCMTDDYVSPYPAEQYGEGTLERSGESPWHQPRPPIPPNYVKESYEGLEDADEFAPNQCVVCGGDNGDWGLVFDKHCAICGDPVCDECAEFAKRGDTSTGPAACAGCKEPICPGCDTREGPGFEMMCDNCRERQYEQSLEQSYEDAWLRNQGIGESYEGLEDEDQFINWQCSTRGCEADSDFLICNNCNSVWCDSCSLGAGFRPMQIDDPNYQPGHLDGCPNCQEITESYEGLEDEDEFRDPDSCMHCGRTDDMRRQIHTYECSVHGCQNRTCQHCMDENGWDYDYATDTGSVATCPECLATYDIS